MNNIYIYSNIAVWVEEIVNLDTMCQLRQYKTEQITDRMVSKLAWISSLCLCECVFSRLQHQQFVLTFDKAQQNNHEMTVFIDTLLATFHCSVCMQGVRSDIMIEFGVKSKISNATWEYRARNRNWMIVWKPLRRFFSPRWTLQTLLVNYALI